MKGQKKSAGADALQPALSPMHLSPPYVKCSRPFQAELNKASGSEPVPEQVCDSSTCVSAGARFSFSRPDKESDLWQNERKKKKKKKKDLSAPWQAGAIQRIRLPPTPTCSPQMMLTGCWEGRGGAGMEEGWVQVSLISS